MAEAPDYLRRTRVMLVVAAVGLFVSGVTIWPGEVELELALAACAALGLPEARPA
jgi:hypothetical protein